MSPETLKAFKTEARKLSDIYEVLSELWNGKLEHGNNATFPEVVIVGVILHNIAFNGSDCHGYHHDKELEEVRKNISVLRKLNEYYDGMYMINFAYNEIDNLFIGFGMSEDM